MKYGGLGLGLETQSLGLGLEKKSYLHHWYFKLESRTWWWKHFFTNAL